MKYLSGVGSSYLSTKRRNRPAKRGEVGTMEGQAAIRHLLQWHGMFSRRTHLLRMLLMLPT